MGCFNRWCNPGVGLVVMVVAWDPRVLSGLNSAILFSREGPFSSFNIKCFKMLQIEQLEENLKNIQMQRIRTVKRRERTAEERRNLIKQLERATTKIQRAREFWNRKIDELATGIGKLQNTTRNHHATSAENLSLVEQQLLSQKQQLEDLEDSTRRNIKTIKWQAEEDVSNVYTWISQTVSYIDSLEKRSHTLIRESKLSSKDSTRPSMLHRYLPRVREVLFSLFILSRDIVQTREKHLAQLYSISRMPANIASTSHGLRVQGALLGLEFVFAHGAIQKGLAIAAGRGGDSASNDGLFFFSTSSSS
uniref:Uncharacterized protein n=1 Tax=Eptatretus burgeri TaxID=7764 RepID=A0A8C4NBD8_EPTBU